MSFEEGVLEVMQSKKAGPRWERRTLARTGVILCCVLLAACGKETPVEEQGCDAPNVQTLAKKLVVMHINDAMIQKDDGQRLIEQYSRQANRKSGVDTTLNTIRSKSIDANRVTLTGIEQLRSPADAKSDQTGANHDEYLFICAARARIKLPPAAMSRVAGSGLAQIPEVLDIQGDTIAPRIVYTTSVGTDQRLEVGMAFENQILDMALGVLLRDAIPNAAP